MASDRNGRMRCPECGSLVRDKERYCAVCGRALPMRISLPSMVLESAVVVAVVLVVGVGLMWARGTGRGPWSDSSQALPELLAEAPTIMPTSTPKSSPTPSVPPNTARPATATPMPETVTHVVASGDTLYGIAGQYGVDPDSIIGLNELERPDALSIGQQLLIPMSVPPRSGDGDADTGTTASGGPDAEATSGAESPGGAGAEPPVSAAANGEPIVVRDAEAYTVEAGDTLLGIAQQHGLTLEGLLAINADRIDGPGASLQVGDSIVVVAAVVVTTTPGPRATAPSAPVVDAVGNLPAVPDLSDGEKLFASPLPLAPTHGVVVTGQAPLLRWTSAGVMPADVTYVVSVREAGGAEGDAWTEWVSSHATAVYVPSRFRPALGSTRDIEWSVAVRRRADTFGPDDAGAAVGVAMPWQRFTWSPGQGDVATEETRP